MDYGVGLENRSSPKTGTGGSNPSSTSNFMSAAACVYFLREKPVKKSEWLKDRPETLRKLPRPTLAEVRAQFAASYKFKKNLEGKLAGEPGPSAKRIVP